jgi:hypothetical protein
MDPSGCFVENAPTSVRSIITVNSLIAGQEGDKPVHDSTRNRRSGLPFAADKSDRFFTVIKFWLDETSGIALALRTGVPPTKSKMRKAEFIYCFTCQSKKRLKSAGAFGGPIKPALIRGLFSMARWSRIRKARYWSQRDSQKVCL